MLLWLTENDIKPAGGMDLGGLLLAVLYLLAADAAIRRCVSHRWITCLT